MPRDSTIAAELSDLDRRLQMETNPDVIQAIQDRADSLAQANGQGPRFGASKAVTRNVGVVKR